MEQKSMEREIYGTGINRSTDKIQLSQIGLYLFDTLLSI